MNIPPPPPPPPGLPPPPPPYVPAAIPPPPPSADDLTKCQEALLQACRHLEQNRCQEAELEGCLYLGSHILSSKNKAATTANSSSEEEPIPQDNVPLPVKEVVQDILAQYPRRVVDKKTVSDAAGAMDEFPPPGQWGQAVQTSVLSGSLKGGASLAADIQSQRQKDAENSTSSLRQTWKTAKTFSPQVWLSCLDERLRELQAYHARHNHDEADFLLMGISMPSANDAADGEQGNDDNDLRMEQVQQQVEARAHKRARVVSDGFDLASMAKAWYQPVLDADEGADDAAAMDVDGEADDRKRYRTQELLGKYLDLNQFAWVETLMSLVRATREEKEPNKPQRTTTFNYPDLLQTLLEGLDQLSEAAKLQKQNRKAYARFLVQLQDYLCQYLNRTMPLLNFETQIIDKARQSFVAEWSQTGGFSPGWKSKPVEAVLVKNSNGKESEGGPDQEKKEEKEGIDLSQYETSDALAKAVDGEMLKAELARLGLKCGGTVADRSKRLFVTKNKDRSEWPRKIFAKGASAATTTSSQTKDNNNKQADSNTNATPAIMAHGRRVDLAEREAIVTALLHQVRPTLEATLRRMERKQGQTLNEQETEIEEDLYGSDIVVKTKKKKTDDDDDGSDDDDEDDAPVYNPKNVPLDWDGKPIPYWLFKLHGLNHYYECEICGGESYRGRRNFEVHFADPKHAMGMKNLGIPNTKHFHGVTKIEDAKALWKTLQGKLEQEKFDASKEEEYEDSNGNVLSRTTYEDLARQGLL